MAAKATRRLERIERTTRLISSLVKGQELTRDQAAELLGVGLRAADRQVNAVGRHFALVKGRRSDGRRTVRLASTSVIDRPTPPSLAAMISVCLGSSLGALFEGTPYEIGMRDALGEVTKGSRHPEWFKEISRKFVFITGGGEVALPENHGQLEDIIQALQRNKWIRIRYRGFGRPAKNVRVQPLSLAVYQHQLYMIAREDNRRPRVLRFARIERVDVQKESFEYPVKSEYDTEQLFAQSFGVFIDDAFPVEQVEISLDRRWWSFLKTHRWHRSQTAELLGSRIRLTLRVRLCPELEGWILSLGPDAVVDSPPKLQRRIAALARKTAGQYAGVRRRRTRR